MKNRDKDNPKMANMQKIYYIFYPYFLTSHIEKHSIACLDSIISSQNQKDVVLITKN